VESRIRNPAAGSTDQSNQESLADPDDQSLARSPLKSQMGASLWNGIRNLITFRKLRSTNVMSRTLLSDQPVTREREDQERRKGGGKSIDVGI